MPLFAQVPQVVRAHGPPPRLVRRRVRVRAGRRGRARPLGAAVRARRGAAAGDAERRVRAAAGGAPGDEQRRAQVQGARFESLAAARRCPFAALGSRSITTRVRSVSASFARRFCRWTGGFLRRDVQRGCRRAAPTPAKKKMPPMRSQQERKQRPAKGEAEHFVPVLGIDAPQQIQSSTMDTVPAACSRLWCLLLLAAATLNLVLRPHEEDG